MSKIIFVLLLFIAHAFADGEYIKHESSLQQLSSQIANGEKHLREALEEKNHTKDTEKYYELVKEIQEGLKKRKDDIERYNKEIHHIKFEHPERVGQFEKKYKRYDEKAIKEFEDEMNKLLSEVQQNVKKKYNP